MNPATHAVPPSPGELEALLRLLDDETPEVRERVAERLGQCGGDLSEWLSTRAGNLSENDAYLLSEMLAPARREQISREWIVPSGGAATLQEDWDAFEALLRVFSDFLHDGISLRQPLSDALDLLAEEATETGVGTPDELRRFLFLDDRLMGNRESYYDPRNSDLAWSIAEGKSNPLGLCLIFMLVARRLNLEVEGVNFPGHFMCRIFEDGFPMIVDCFDNGHLHMQSELLENPEINRSQRDVLRQSADAGTILLRLLNNAFQALEQMEREEDAALVKDLLESLS